MSPSSQAADRGPRGPKDSSQAAVKINTWVPAHRQLTEDSEAQRAAHRQLPTPPRGGCDRSQDDQRPVPAHRQLVEERLR